jgi:hypothetical protein
MRHAGDAIECIGLHCRDPERASRKLADWYREVLVQAGIWEAI